jgi:hypothetical protein
LVELDEELELYLSTADDSVDRCHIWPFESHIWWSSSEFAKYSKDYLSLQKQKENLLETLTKPVEPEVVLLPVKMKSMVCCKESFNIDSYHSELRAASRRARLVRSELLQPIVPMSDSLNLDLQTMASKSIKLSVVESLTGEEKNLIHGIEVKTEEEVISESHDSNVSLAMEIHHQFLTRKENHNTCREEKSEEKKIDPISDVNEADDHQCLVMGGEVLKVSIGLEVEAFGLRNPNRSNNVSPHCSSIHLNSSSGYSDDFLETTGVGSSTDGVVFESIEQSNNGNQVELCNLNRSRYLLASVGHCGRSAGYSFNELQHHDSLGIPIPVAFGLGEASMGGAKCSFKPQSIDMNCLLHLSLGLNNKVQPPGCLELLASLGDFGRPPEYPIRLNHWTTLDLSTLAQVLDCQRLASVMLVPAAFDFSGRISEALTGGAKCSLTLSYYGDFGRPPESGDFGSQCNHQSLGWSVNPYPGLQALLICSVLESIVKFLCHGMPGRPPDLEKLCSRLVEIRSPDFGCIGQDNGLGKASAVGLKSLTLSRGKFGNFGHPPDVSAVETSMVGAKSSWMALSLQAKSGNFSRPPESIDFSSCNHQRLEWSGNLCQRFQALISDVSAGGAGEDLIIKVNLSPACSALKDISVLFGKLSGPRRPDWIVKCLSGFNGSQHHDSLTMIGEASTGGAKCSQILSPSPWFNRSQHHDSLTMIGEASTGGAKCSVRASCGDFGRPPESMIKMSYWLNMDLSMQYPDSWKKMFSFSFGDGEALTGRAKCCLASSHLFGNLIE